MGKGGRKKAWPRSWKQAAASREALTLKGRGFEAAYVVVPLRVEVETPAEMERRVIEAIVTATRVQRPS